METARLGEAGFFAAGFDAGLAGRTALAPAFLSGGFFAATSFLTGRCGLTTVLAEDFFAAAFFGAAFFTAALTAFFTGRADFFGTGFRAAPVPALPDVFPAGLADLRFDVAIILHHCRLAVACYSPIAPRRQPLPVLRLPHGAAAETR